MKKYFLLPALTACFLGLSAPAVSATEQTPEPSHFLTETEVNDIFGDLPHYIDFGSFLLNRMNTIPISTFDNHYMLVEENDDTTELTPEHSHFLTEAEVNDIFGDLPRYFDLGSFLLNRMNNIPMPAFDNHYMLVEKNDGTLVKTRPSFSTLQNQLEKLLASYQGDWSIYIKDLKTEEVISINEHSMQSASLIKLYIAGTTLERIENGLLQETDTISNALKQMIVVSDNESSNVLVRSFYKESEGQHFQDGLDVVNDFIDRHGYTNTKQVNGIADPSLWVNDGSVNHTSTADCGKILEDIYNSELVSHFASFRFEKLLNNQEVNYKIPSALPEGTHISHKTGEVSDTENDAAIIYTPYGDYIYCIMSTQLESTSTAVDNIRAITRIVHNWFIHPIEIIEPEATEATN